MLFGPGVIDVVKAKQEQRQKRIQLHEFLQSRGSAEDAAANLGFASSNLPGRRPYSAARL